MSRSRAETKLDHSSITSIGIGVQHFPHYVNRSVRMHGLDVVLISFIVRGHGIHHIEDDCFEEHGASMAVTHYGQRHDIVTDADGMEIINVYLDLEHHPLPILPPSLQSVLPLLLPVNPQFVHRLNRIVRLQFDDPAPLAHVLLSIRDEIANQAPGYIETVQLLWKLFLIHCCRHALAKGFVRDLPPRHTARHRLEQLRQHIDVTYSESHNPGIARQACPHGAHIALPRL